MTLVTAVEPLHPFVDEAADLFHLHYEEIGDQSMVLNYDVGFYDALEAAGRLFVHTLRDDGELVGYHLWTRYHHPRYKTTIIGNSDILYLHPDSRQGLVGYKFLKFSIAELRRLGVKRLMFHTKPHLDYGPLLVRLGAKFFESTYALTLE